MQDFIRKLDRKFIVIEPSISTHKAFELLAEPNVDILVYMSSNNSVFYYLTDREIRQNIQKNNEINNTTVKEIANKSLIFDSDLYFENKNEYQIKFNNYLSTLGQSTPEKFLVLAGGKPVGLVSDIVLSVLLETKEPEFRSELDKFIEAEADPRMNIDKFFEKLIEWGYNITPKVKAYVKEVLEIRMKKSQESSSMVNDELKLQPKLDIEEIAGRNTTENGSKSGKSKETIIAVTYNPNHINHSSSTSSPETPERLMKIMDLLKGREKVFDTDCRLISDYPPATEEDLFRVHTQRYVDFVKNYAERGGGFLGDSTYITKTTHELALLAVGGAIKAANEVLAKHAEFGLGLIRPPGHHAGKDKYGGYCIYNNAAILARYLQEVKGLDKILILDWDAHAANGTMEIFYDDPSVMLISIHQDPHNFYPKTGFISQLGKSNGLGYTVNVEMPKGSGDDEYLTVFNELVLPLFEKFQPDFVIGCNGFDPHHSDQYTELYLTSKAYFKFATIFKQHMKNKMVILMEGGYNPSMGELTHTLINGLLGLPNPFEDKFQSLVQKVVSDEKTYMILNDKIKELKYNLNRYNVL